MNENTDPPINGHNHDDPNPDMPLCVLEDVYREALIGHTVAFDQRPRFCYSLVVLTRIEKRRAHDMVDDDTARRSVWENIVMRVTRTHGANAPVFIDDAATRQEEPSIITPFRRN